MATYDVEYTTHINLIVTITADDMEAAAEDAGGLAEEYLRTLGHDRVQAYATLDGIGYDKITEVTKP